MLSSATPSTEEKSRFLQKINKQFPVSIGEAIGWDADTIYGEVLFSTLSEAFDKLRTLNLLPPGGVFFDLGSGIGKAVIFAALLHDFSECIGIELLPGLHSLACRLQAKYLKHKSHLSSSEVAFINADIFSYDWSKASVFFVNATCFDELSFQKINDSPVRPGTIAITTTKRLKKTQWRLLDSSHKGMTWGKAKVFIHTRL